MDINLFRTEKGNPDLVRESQRRRGAPVEVVDKVIALDAHWRQLSYELSQIRSRIHALSKEISEKKKAKQECQELIDDSKALGAKASALEPQVATALKERDDVLNSIGNLVHASVPVSLDEKDNELIKTFGTNKPTTDSLKHHHELLHMIDGFDNEIGAEVAGHRGYYLKGWGMLLNQALVNHGLSFLYNKGYTPLQTPFFMKKEAMGKVAALAEFDDSLYKVTGSGDEEMYLIATSEQPCCAFHFDVTLGPKDLPKKYVGYSTCFRKEAGAHGKDVQGIFRVHQFEKIEQFVVTAPDKSWEMHETLLAISEEFMQSLGFSYRVVNIVSGELNNAAAKKYDLEAWFPTRGEYRELVSCSNCTDWQARRLKTKYGVARGENEAPVFVHMLNSTLCATERTLCCLLENYQTEKGIKIPKILQSFLAPYTHKLADPELIPFVQGPPAVSKGAKGQQKKQ